MTSSCHRFFLLGPTASGKTAISIALAPRLNAEILSLDSMLLYKRMDIGTAKPSLEEREGVPHHLMDLVEPSSDFSVASYLREAETVEADLQARNRTALYAGGTPLYFKALVHGLHDLPPVPPELRQALLEQSKTDAGLSELKLELQRVDQVLFDRLHPNDLKRLLRGLETWRVTGRPLSSWQAEWKSEPTTVDVPAIALRWDRDSLRERVARRFHMMLEHGFLDEVRQIQETCGFSQSAAKGIGYAQVLDHLNGLCSLEEAMEQAITRTRVLIRRQMTWLRSFPDLAWLDVKEGDDPSILAERACAIWASHFDI